MTSDSGPHIKLVAAVIEREGRYLITQRRPTAVLPGLWEFPGGKVEPGETDESALKRELRERVGVEVEVKLRMAQRTHQYDGYSVDLTLYQAASFRVRSRGPCGWLISAGQHQRSSRSTRSRPPIRQPRTFCSASSASYAHFYGSTGAQNFAVVMELGSDVSARLPSVAETRQT
jgi:mutator protein MutT